jgi:hypothetical protein
MISLQVTAQPVGILGLSFVSFRRERGEMTQKITPKPACLSFYLTISFSRACFELCRLRGNIRNLIAGYWKKFNRSFDIPQLPQKCRVWKNVVSV